MITRLSLKNEKAPHFSSFQIVCNSCLRAESDTPFADPLSIAGLRAKMIQKRAFYARNQGVGCSQPRRIVSSFLKISFVMPLILFWIRVPASAMSLNLALSLRGIANFPKYSIAHIRLQTARRHNINRTTERFFKQLFDGDQIKETALVRKLDEAIDIRIGS